MELVPNGHLWSCRHTKEKIRRSWELYGKRLFLVASSSSHLCVCVYFFVCVCHLQLKAVNFTILFILFVLQKGSHKLIRIDYINARNLFQGAEAFFSVHEAPGEQPFIVNVCTCHSVHSRGKGGGRPKQFLLQWLRTPTLHLLPTSSPILLCTPSKDKKEKERKENFKHAI